MVPSGQWESIGVKPDYEMDYIMEYMLSAMLGVLGYWFRQDDPPSHEKLIELMYILMREGTMGKLRKKLVL